MRTGKRQVYSKISKMQYSKLMKSLSIVEQLCDDPDDMGWTESCHKLFINQNIKSFNLNYFSDFCFKQLNNPELAIENLLRGKQVSKIVQVIIFVMIDMD